MTAGALLVATSSLALAWKLYQLWRAPRDHALQVVVTFLALLTLAIILAETGASTASAAGLLTLNLCSLAFVYLLSRFFLVTSDDPAAPRRARHELGVLAAATATMTGAMLATPAPARRMSFLGPLHHTPTMALFYATGSAYLAYGLAVATHLTWRAATHTDNRVALGLRIAAAGLLGCQLSALARFALTAQRTLGHIPPLSSDHILGEVLVASFVVFLAGVTYPGLATRVVSAARWLRHRRRYTQMEPLWSVLHDAFPHDELTPRPARPGLRKVHYRHYRRAIECRDGLVQLSPYLAARLDHTTGGLRAITGADVLAALQDRAADRPVSTSAVLVAHPASDDLDDDVAELIRLAATLNHH